MNILLQADSFKLLLYLLLRAQSTLSHNFCQPFLLDRISSKSIITTKSSHACRSNHHTLTTPTHLSLLSFPLPTRVSRNSATFNVAPPQIYYSTCQAKEEKQLLVMLRLRHQDLPKQVFNSLSVVSIVC